MPPKANWHALCVHVSECFLAGVLTVHQCVWAFDRDHGREALIHPPSPLWKGLPSSRSLLGAGVL